MFIIQRKLSIRDLGKTSKISDNNLVEMSIEMCERYVHIDRIDHAIFEAEKEMEDGEEPIPVQIAMKMLDKKHYG